MIHFRQNIRNILEKYMRNVQEIKINIIKNTIKMPFFRKVQNMTNYMISSKTELHVTLKRRHVKICEHPSFFLLIGEIVF